ncbi:unnamed protein product [Notodromas monacha]|uniref:Methyltransferase domain-containing protein n=1 Tax=Notodromas monacha TaxID=399045 RepID=A0A7R9BKL4_9CRUS|nr:unnamed protein product [Notodromas monacha]CAG0915707.1 unnamed protein product [Notodromas monacha]
MQPVCEKRRSPSWVVRSSCVQLSCGMSATPIREKACLYFAYGSNLLTARLRIGCPSAVKVDIAQLKDFRLDFNYFSRRWQGAAATIVGDRNSRVWGIVWKISQDDLAHLDEQEGVKKAIYRRFRVEVRNGSSFYSCWTYQLVRPLEDDRRPSTVYKSVIISGALENELPEDYVAQLRSISDNGYDGPVEEFFTEDHWGKVPEDWRQFLEAAEVDTVRNVIANSLIERSEDPNWNMEMPETLANFFVTCGNSSLPRNAVANLRDVDEIFSEVQPTEDNWICGTQLMTVSGGCRRHVKPKKQHEISRMAKVVSVVAKTTHSSVTDLGSGLGHLARILCNEYSLDVLGIEEQPRFTEQARIFDLESQSLGKEGEVSKLPEHVTFSVKPWTSGRSMLKEVGKENLRSTLCGLHTCGDLGPAVLRMFAETQEIVGLCSVACCYMKLSATGDFVGFPMCKRLSSENFSLSYEAKELACHALESFVNGKLVSGYERLKIHCYRAMLEKLLIQHDGQLKRIGVRGVKNAHLMDFSEYAHCAILKLDTINAEELNQLIHLNSDWLDAAAKNWKRVLLFYLLRLCIAPVIETVLLLDRMMFLFEQGDDLSKFFLRNHLIPRH